MAKKDEEIDWQPFEPEDHQLDPYQLPQEFEDDYQYMTTLYDNDWSKRAAWAPDVVVDKPLPKRKCNA